MSNLAFLLLFYTIKLMYTKSVKIFFIYLDYSQKSCIFFFFFLAPWPWPLTIFFWMLHFAFLLSFYTIMPNCIKIGQELLEIPWLQDSSRQSHTHTHTHTLTYDLWPMTYGPWHVTRDIWLMICELWLVTRDLWLVTHDLWLVTLDIWLVTRGL